MSANTRIKITFKSGEVREYEATNGMEEKILKGEMVTLEFKHPRATEHFAIKQEEPDA